MTLVDTSVWVDHLRRGNPKLASLLADSLVSCHPFIVGELACGTLRRRAEILGLLESLPEAPVLRHREVLGFVADRGLAGRGIGWVDVHLLASALLGGTGFWTLDRRLAEAAGSLGLPAPRG